VGTVLTIVVIALIAAGAWWLIRQRGAAQARELEDAKSEARRWVERLGGQVLNLVGTDDASKQALADAAERYNAAGSQMEQARSVVQARQVIDTAREGLYYVRAARTAMGLDPGPELPPLPGQQRAGAVSEEREVDVEGHSYSAAPVPSGRNQHYYPGGVVAGRPVPQGWYSEPWWKPALVAGAWGVGSALLFSAMFSGMSGVAYADGFADGAANGDGDFDGAGADDAQGDVGADMGGDPGGFDAGGFDDGGFDAGFGDF
jgi:type II secretory pathway pseudopilin PulG